MGNCVSASCTEIKTPKIRVVQATEGRVVDVEVPLLQSSMMVGELMLEFPPGHFVAQLNKADFLPSTTGKRAAPLGADAEAKPGDVVYVLLPMLRMHTRITSQELLCFAKLLHLHDQQLAKAVYNRQGLFTAGRARVAPLVGKEDDSGADTDQEETSPTLPISFMKQQMSEQEPIPYPDSSSLFIMSSCQSHIAGWMKPKPWAPKLQTIMESS